MTIRALTERVMHDLFALSERALSTVSLFAFVMILPFVLGAERHDEHTFLIP